MELRRPPSCASSGAAVGGEVRELHAVAEEMDEEALREVPARGTRMKLQCEAAGGDRDEAAGGDRDEEQPGAMWSGPTWRSCQFLAKFRSFSAVSAPIFARKYGFFSIFQFFFFFFKIYQIIQLKFLKFGNILQILQHLQNFAEFSRKLLIFKLSFC